MSLAATLRTQLQIFGVCSTLVAVASAACTTRVSFQICTTWDSQPVGHDPVRISLHREQNGSIPIHVDAPFFNNTPVPSGPAGQPFFRLWDYEVVEVFILGSDDRYVEVELSPHGQHLVLLLDGQSKAIKHSLPLVYRATIQGNRWEGRALLPVSYLPPNPTRMNAYAIHETKDERQHEALYPVPHGAFDEPNFHRLNYFANMMLGPLFKSNVSCLTDLWQKALDAHKLEEERRRTTKT